MKHILLLKLTSIPSSFSYIKKYKQMIHLIVERPSQILKRRCCKSWIPFELMHSTQHGERYEASVITKGSGSGTNRVAWVESLHTELCDKFDRLGRVFVKFNYTMLSLLALSIWDCSSNGLYVKGLIDKHNENTKRYLIESPWIQSFCDFFRSDSRFQTDKLRMSTE